MRYGKVVDGKITNWLDIDPSDTLKIQKATAKGYRPEKNTKPEFTEYQRLELTGWDVQPDRLTRLYSVVEKSKAEKDAIDERKAKAEEISTNLESWLAVDSDIDKIATTADVKAFLKTFSRAVYVHIKDSLE